MIWRILLFVLGGAALGFGYQRLIGCRSGMCVLTRRTPTWRPFTVLSWVTWRRAVFVDAGTRLATAGAMCSPPLSLMARSARLARPAQGLRWSPDGC